MLRFVAVLAAIVCGSAHAADLSAQSRAEIDYLFSYLQESGCRFNRNGKWHSADETVSHLGTKYKYLLEKDMLSSTEDFIDKAATSSSMSGKLYLVACADEKPVESSVWFRAGLSKYRAEKR